MKIDIVSSCDLRYAASVMGIFSKAKNLYNLQKQAKAIKKDLRMIHIESETDGIVATLTAEQEFVKIEIPDGLWNELKTQDFGKKKLQDILLKVLNKGMKKAQEIGSAKMKGIWDQMGVGGQ